MNKIILDTNVFNKISSGEGAIVRLVESSDLICVPVIVLGELQIGFKSGTREKQNRVELNRFLSNKIVEVVDVGEKTAEIYANIGVELNKKGKPIPTNDMWIAAQAMENGAVLVTYDRHFREIAGLRVWPGG